MPATRHCGRFFQDLPRGDVRSKGVFKQCSGSMRRRGGKGRGARPATCQTGRPFKLPDWPGFHWVGLLTSVMFDTCFHLFGGVVETYVSVNIAKLPELVKRPR